MKIVQLLSQTHLTGAEAHAAVLAEGLRAQGHEVTLISDRWHLPTSIPFVSRPVHQARGWRRWREAWWLRRYLRAEKIDIVHAHSRAAVRIAWWATRGLPTALVSTVHGRQHFSWGKRLFDTYGERVIAVCGALKKHLLEDFHVRDSRVRVLGNPLVLPSADSVRAQASSPRRWLFVTRWTGPKGERAREFLNLLPEWMDNHPDLEMHLAGSPPEPRTPAARQWGDLQARYGPRLRHLGFVDQVEGIFPSYGLIVGGGRIALAAAALGKACFAFGEASTCGLLRPANLPSALFSNFGDIEPQAQDTPLRADLARREIEEFLRGQEPAPEDLALIAERVRREVEAETVVKDIVSIYQSARLLKRHPRPIPVLMYHQVTESPIDTPHRIFVTRETFRRHLWALRRRGRVALTFQDLLDFKQGRRPLSEFPRRPVILTFDDGYLNNLTLAAPLLKEFGFRAVIFLLADASLRANTWDQGAAPQVPLMTAPERRALFDTGVFEIGSHGFHHRRLPEMRDEEALHELRESARRLREEFGVKIPSFAFTYGDIDERSADLARRAGYDYAVNTDRGAVLLEEDPHAVFRINVFPEDGPAAITKKTSWWYRWRYYFKRGR
ncbi:MAG: polysaccharide deacetylase family protein [Bdellovibrionaceae bacterium]|nr:polysaccharide deacetylase family protein [Pseudobdellovibrionaceae bacterium]